jgi:DNA-binding helix-hairpin-helix protein with protein kinase domain
LKSESLTKDFKDEKEIFSYNAAISKFNEVIIELKRLPDELNIARKALEERLYKEQLVIFLLSFDIRHHPIPKFGATKKLNLYNSGIRNAADIYKLRSIKIQGIGPKNEQVLYDWQRQMISRYTYKPDNHKMEAEVQKIIKEAVLKKNKIENEIKARFQSLEAYRISIQNKKVLSRTQLMDIQPLLQKAEVEYKSFKRFAKDF